MSSIHLLDHLAMLVGLDCLSDLREFPAVRPALLCTPAGAFPAPMWWEALYYLTGESLPDAGPEVCRDHLLTFYEKTHFETSRLFCEGPSSPLDTRNKW